jgi:hypothetical protein
MWVVDTRNKCRVRTRMPNLAHHWISPREETHVGAKEELRSVVISPHHKSCALAVHEHGPPGIGRVRLLSSIGPSLANACLVPEERT